MPRPGRIYKRFKTEDGTNVILRAARRGDLDSLLSFINALVKEKARDRDSALYGGFDRRVTRREEAKWLAKTLRAIDREEIISVVAEIDGRIIANGEMTRGRYDDTRHHDGLIMTRKL